MRTLIIFGVFAILLSSCKKQNDSPFIDKSAIIGKWKLKSLNRKVYLKQYPDKTANIPYYSQTQNYTLDKEILDIKWHTDYLDSNGNITGSSEAIGDNFEDVLNKSEIEIKRYFTLDVEFLENSMHNVNYISKKIDGTIMKSESYSAAWHWYSLMGSDIIGIQWALPNFFSPEHVYDLHDNTFIIKSNLETGNPDVNSIHPQYKIDENEVVFERIK